MLKYFRNKRVFIECVLQNELGGYDETLKTITFDNFNIYDWGRNGFKIELKKKGETLFDLEIEYYAYFMGLGKIWWISDGPECWFNIKRDFTLIETAKRKFNI